MIQKLVAYALVFLIAFVVCLRLLEVSNLVAVSVDTQVSAGNVEVESAPRLAKLFELVVAAVVALFITTGRIGDWAAAGLIKLWTVLRGRVSNSLARNAGASLDAELESLDMVLTEHDRRLKNAETVLDRISARDRELESRLAKAEAAFGDLQQKHNSLVDRTKPHKKEIADLQELFSVLELRVVTVETAVAAQPAARPARSTRKKAGA